MQDANAGTRAGMLPPAVYANFLRIAQRHSELFLVFGQVAQDQQAAAHVLSAFVTSPAHAKAMLRTLQQAVERYEKRFGEIPEIEAPRPPPGSDAGTAVGMRSQG